MSIYHMIVVHFANDWLIAYNKKGELENIKMELYINSKLKDLGESLMILGIGIFRNQEVGLCTVFQSRNAQRIMEQFGMESKKWQNKPMDDNARLMQGTEQCIDPYHVAIRWITKLMVSTRPYLPYLVTTHSRFVESSTEIHWVAVQRVLL